MKLLLPTLTLTASFTLCAQTPPAAGKIQVLIITGQDKHPWRETTPYLREILTQTDKFEVRVTEEFRNGNLETLAPYDVAVLNYSDEKLDIPTWSPASKNALLAFVRAGKGVVVYHHSAASFQDWEELEKLKPKLRMWRTTQSHHSPVHDYQVDIRDAEHPIMRGLAPFQVKSDELYADLKCRPAADFHVLATGFDDHSLYVPKPRDPAPSGPSRNEFSLLWTVNYGSGRVFATMLGNDMRAVRTCRLLSPRSSGEPSGRLPELLRFRRPRNWPGKTRRS